MDAYKNRIKAIVKDYMLKFPDEYRTVKKELADKRNATVSKFAAIKNTDLLERAIHEIPMTLDSMLTLEMEDEAIAWFRSKEGARWFAGAFQAFASPDVI